MFLNKLRNVAPDFVAHPARYGAALPVGRARSIVKRPFVTPRCAGKNRTGALFFSVAKRDEKGHALPHEQINFFRCLIEYIQPHFIHEGNAVKGQGLLPHSRAQSLEAVPGHVARERFRRLHPATVSRTKKQNFRFNRRYTLTSQAPNRPRFNRLVTSAEINRDKA